MSEIPTLRMWRQAQGITLEELADVTGFSVPMLSRVERGERQLSALARIRFARLLGVRVREIFPPLTTAEELEQSQAV